MKPSRPFGLMLAILTAWMLFTVIPLVVTMLTFSISSYIYRDTTTGALSGTSISNFQPGPYILIIAAAVFMAFVGIFAWRGRPARMRVILPVTVGLYTAVTVLGVLIPALTTSPSLAQGLDSSQGVAEKVLSGYSGMTLLFSVYCAWFCNRWSSRAFFRGYYTEKDKRTLEAAGLTMTAPESL